MILRSTSDRLSRSSIISSPLPVSLFIHGISVSHFAVCCHPLLCRSFILKSAKLLREEQKRRARANYRVRECQEVFSQDSYGILCISYMNSCVNFATKINAKSKTCVYLELVTGYKKRWVFLICFQQLVAELVC